MSRAGRIVEKNAGENCENVGLEKGDQQFESLSLPDKVARACLNSFDYERGSWRCQAHTPSVTRS